ncbi:MAG: HAD family phosphatase [Gemmatimonadota bacterium]|jgi:HAD superfamily hydrolase (TIGR01509 family)
MEKRPRKAGAVLWDLDGTLADSKEYHWRSWVRAMEEEGRSVTEAQFLASFGQRNDTILGEWLGPDPDPGQIVRVGDAKEAYYRELVRSEGIEPLPGAAEWVRRLHQEGWGQAIASSAPKLNVEVMHSALGFSGLIEILVAAEDVSRGKPDPEVFLRAASGLGVPPHRCVVVEDAAAGIEAARQGGMRSIGVGGGEVGAADVAVESLADLPPETFQKLVDRG